MVLVAIDEVPPAAFVLAPRQEQRVALAVDVVLALQQER